MAATGSARPMPRRTAATVVPVATADPVVRPVTAATVAPVARARPAWAAPGRPVLRERPRTPMVVWVARASAVAMAARAATAGPAVCWRSTTPVTAVPVVPVAMVATAVPVGPGS